MIQFSWGLLIGAAFTVLFSVNERNTYWRGALIQRDMGLYCPDTGEFAFIGECGK